MFAQKKSCPSDCWDRMQIQPAVPPGLTLLAPDSSRTIIRSSLFTEELLRLTYFSRNFYEESVFQFALRSPFPSMAHTAIPPPAALCNVLHRKYLLSVISLSHYSMRKVMCQYKIQFIFVKKNKK